MRLSGVRRSDETTKNRHSRCGTIKTPPCSKVVKSTMHRLKMLQPFTGKVDVSIMNAIIFFRAGLYRIYSQLTNFTVCQISRILGLHQWWMHLAQSDILLLSCCVVLHFENDKLAHVAVLSANALQYRWFNWSLIRKKYLMNWVV